MSKRVSISSVNTQISATISISSRNSINNSEKYRYVYNMYLFTIICHVDIVVDTILETVVNVHVEAVVEAGVEIVIVNEGI